MTETRPTPDLNAALRVAKDICPHPYRGGTLLDEELLSHTLIALAAENKALEERVRSYEVCWHCRDCLEQPELPAHCESCPQYDDCDVEGCEEPGCNTIVLSVREDGTPLLATVRTVDDAKAAGEPPVAVSAALAKSLTKLLHPTSDDRASRRRAYVRDKAPGLLKAALRGGSLATVERAIEQAGLIFDETEQSE